MTDGGECAWRSRLLDKMIVGKKVQGCKLGVYISSEHMIALLGQCLS